MASVYERNTTNFLLHTKSVRSLPKAPEKVLDCLGWWTTTTSTFSTGRLPMWYADFIEARYLLRLLAWMHIVQLTLRRSSSGSRSLCRIYQVEPMIDCATLRLQVAIALGGGVHLFNAETGTPSALCSLPQGDIVTSLSWCADGKHLAVGTSASKVHPCIA